MKPNQIDNKNDPNPTHTQPPNNNLDKINNKYQHSRRKIARIKIIHPASCTEVCNCIELNWDEWLVLGVLFTFYILFVYIFCFLIFVFFFFDFD